MLITLLRNSQDQLGPTYEGLSIAPSRSEFTKTHQRAEQLFERKRIEIPYVRRLFLSSAESNVHSRTAASCIVAAAWNLAVAKCECSVQKLSYQLINLERRKLCTRMTYAKSSYDFLVFIGIIKPQILKKSTMLLTPEDSIKKADSKDNRSNLAEPNLQKTITPFW